MNKKFRFWCKGTSTNKNFNKCRWWAYPNFLLSKYFSGLDIFESEHFVACQYVGVNDDSGQPIYEGDILLVKDGTLTSYILVEKHKVGFMGFTATTPNGSNAFIWHDLNDTFEVVGNIYENPELIQK